MRLNSKTDSLAKAAGLLISGTALGQAILLLSLPVLTRLYSPEDFNTLAVFVAVIGLFGGAVCLRFDIAISIPESNTESLKLLQLSLLASTLLSSLVGSSVWLVGYLTDIDYGIDSIGFSVLVGFGLLTFGAFNAFQMWYVRSKKFGAISATKLGQAIFSVVVQIGVGLSSGKVVGLFLGYISNSAVGAAVFLLSMIRSTKGSSIISWVELVALFKKYQRFPKYSALESLANEGASQLPVLLIAFLIGGAEAGFLMLAMRVLQAPIGLIGNAVAQVYLSEAPQKERNGKLGEFSLGMITRLTKLGVGPLILAGVFAPVLFPIVFGGEWRRAGELISWMTPWFILQFLVSPISMSLHVKGRQDLALYLQISSVLIRLCAVIICYFVSSKFMPEAYALSGFVTYLLYLVFVLRALGLPFGAFAKSIKGSALSLIAFASLAIMGRVVWALASAQFGLGESQ